MIFNKNHWIKLTIAVFMASAGCLASVGDGNDLSLEVEGIQAVRVVVAEGAGAEGANDRNISDERWWIRVGEKTGVSLAILMEALVDTTPVILAYLSDQSPEWALASSVQNMIYAGLYATSIAVNSYRRPHQTPSFEGNLLTIIRLGNVVNSSIAGFISWRYCETHNNTYRLTNTVLNAVSGPLTFALKIAANRKTLHKFWYGTNR